MNQYLQIAALINKTIGQRIESLTEQDVNDILEGQLVFDLVLIPKNSKQLSNISRVNSKPKKETVKKEEPSLEKIESSSKENLKESPISKIEETVTQLRKLNTREEGFAILSDSYFNKKNLQSLAKYIDIRSDKKNTLQDLRERIIEATIGYRLRSQAIQGEIVSVQTTESDRKDIQESSANLTQEE